MGHTLCPKVRWAPQLEAFHTAAWTSRFKNDPFVEDNVMGPFGRLRSLDSWGLDGFREVNDEVGRVLEY